MVTELERGGKLTPALRIIPNLPDPSTRELVSALSVIKMDDLKTGIDSVAQKDVRDNAVEFSAELARTLPPVSGSGAQLLGSYQEMIERIAYERLRTGQDTNGADAAESAYRALLGHYEFDGTLRVPAGVNPGLVRRGLDIRLSDAVLPAMTVADVPMDITGGYNGPESLAAWRDLVENNAVWYTAADDRSAQLWVRGMNGALYRVTQGGQQVAFSFDDLTAASPPRVAPERTGEARRGGLRNPAIIERMRQETGAIERSIEGAQ